MNETFLVDSLNDITEEHFKAACVAAMSTDEELRGLLGVPCGEDMALYYGKDEALVYVRNWSHMLTLFIRTESGTWLDSSHIDGMGVEGVLDEAWRRFCVAKPYIKKRPEKAFKQIEAQGTGLRLMDNTEKYISYIKEVIQSEINPV